MSTLTVQNLFEHAVEQARKHPKNVRRPEVRRLAYRIMTNFSNHTGLEQIVSAAQAAAVINYVHLQWPPGSVATGFSAALIGLLNAPKDVRESLLVDMSAPAIQVKDGCKDMVQPFVDTLKHWQGARIRGLPTTGTATDVEDGNG